MTNKIHNGYLADDNYCNMLSTIKDIDNPYVHFIQLQVWRKQIKILRYFSAFRTDSEKSVAANTKPTIY